MKKNSLSLFTALVLCGLNFVPAAFGITGQAVLAEIQSRYESTNDLEARFVQEFVGKVMRQPQRGEGVVYFKKKGMLRWDYKVPNQKFVSNGQTVWYYQPEENQVLIYELSTLVKEKTPLAFLAGEGNLRRDFDLVNFTEASGAKEENHVVELVPKEPNPGLSKLVLTVDKKTFLVNQADVIDGLGNVTRTRFMGFKTNQGLQNSFFNFSIPPGAEVMKVQEPQGVPPAKGAQPK
jgi:outer membrane lipoprotein carrier protein